jgi:hypothetical protein
LVYSAAKLQKESRKPNVFAIVFETEYYFWLNNLVVSKKNTIWRLFQKPDERKEA